MFVDNAIFHGTFENLPNLRNVQVHFFRKRKTSILQPLDLGVIAWIEKRYQRRMGDRAVDLIEQSVTENIYKVELKLAITWSYDIWYRLQNEVFHNCWVKTLIL